MYDIFTYPKNPWDVCRQVATCFKAPGLSLGGSGVSIGGVRILRVQTWSRLLGENVDKHT